MDIAAKLREASGWKSYLFIIWVLAWPTMLEQFLQTAVQYVDTAMVGSLGTMAAAAVGSTATVNWLVSSTVSALGIGLTALISQAMGAGQMPLAKKASAQAVGLCLVIGTFLTVLLMAIAGQVPVWMQVDASVQSMASSYFFILYSAMGFRCATALFGSVLRAGGDTKKPMQVGLFVNLLNVILNFVLIYPSRVVSIGSFSVSLVGAGWGIQGAAAASAISYTAGGLCIAWVLYKHPALSWKKQPLRPDWSVLRRIFQVALPNMGQRFATSFGYVVFAGMINSLSVTATAAHMIANTVESAFYIPGYGMQAASAAIAGNALGMKKLPLLSRLSKTLLALETLLMSVSGALLFLGAPVLVGLFTKDGQVASLCIVVLRMVALSEPAYGVSIVIEGLMQGLGETKLPFWFHVLGMWGIRIAGTWICLFVFDGTLVEAWACMVAHNLVLFVLFLVVYVSGWWLRHPKSEI